MDSKKLKALKALTTLLEAINPGNGSTFDLSATVYRGKTMLAEDDKAAVSIIQIPPDQFPVTAVEGADTQDNWILYLQGFARATDIKHPIDDAEQLLAEVKVALSVLFASDETGWLVNDLGGTITRCELDLGVAFTDPQKERQDHGQFLLRVMLVFNEDKGNPYG